MRERERGFSHIPTEGEVVQIQCWCEERYVWTAIEDVVAGLTRACPNPECRYQDMKARQNR